MGCLGVHFSLDDEQVAVLKAVNESQLIEFIQEEIEERMWNADKSRFQQTDKAWDGIHRSLTDGRFEWDNGTYPLNRVILGGECVYQRSDYIVSLKSPTEVRDIAAALRGITEAQLRAGYARIDPCNYGIPSEEDFQYTWCWFQPLADFYQRAAALGHWVLFTADQ